MKNALIAAAVFMSFQGTANADLQFSVAAWSAAGILTTQNRDLGYFKTEYVALGPFDTEARCKEAVSMFAMTDEYVGTGGTNKHVDGVQWNYDGTCFRLNKF